MIVYMHTSLSDHSLTTASSPQPVSAYHACAPSPAPRRGWQRGVDRRTEAVSAGTARALDLLPASNMGSTVSRRVDTRVVSVQFSLTLTRWRARGQYGAPPIAQERYCLGACARAASRTCSPQCAASSLVAPKTWLPRRASRSRTPSMRRAIEKLRPGRGRPATQLRRQQLVQNSPARPTRHGLEAQKQWRWIIIIYRRESRVGTPFQPWVQYLFCLNATF